MTSPMEEDPPDPQRVLAQVNSQQRQPLKNVLEPNYGFNDTRAYPITPNGNQLPDNSGSNFLPSNQATRWPQTFIPGSNFQANGHSEWDSRRPTQSLPHHQQSEHRDKRPRMDESSAVARHFNPYYRVSHPPAHPFPGNQLRTNWSCRGHDHSVAPLPQAFKNEDDQFFKNPVQQRKRRAEDMFAVGEGEDDQVTLPCQPRAIRQAIPLPRYLTHGERTAAPTAHNMTVAEESRPTPAASNNPAGPIQYTAFPEQATSLRAARALTAGKQSHRWRPESQIIPITEDAKRYYAKLIYDAIVDFSHYHHAPGTRAPGRRLVFAHAYDETYIAQRAFEVVERTCNLHTNGCSVPTFADRAWDLKTNKEILDKNHRGVPGNQVSFRNLNFHERVTDICDVLRQNKQIACDILDGHLDLEYAIVIAPGLNLSTKKKDNKSNERRALVTRKRNQENQSLKQRAEALQEELDQLRAQRMVKEEPEEEVEAQLDENGADIEAFDEVGGLPDLPEDVGFTGPTHDMYGNELSNFDIPGYDWSTGGLEPLMSFEENGPRNADP